MKIAPALLLSLVFSSALPVTGRAEPVVLEREGYACLVANVSKLKQLKRYPVMVVVERCPDIPNMGFMPLPNVAPTDGEVARKVLSLSRKEIECLERSTPSKTPKGETLVQVDLDCQD